MSGQQGRRKKIRAIGRKFGFDYFDGIESMGTADFRTNLDFGNQLFQNFQIILD